MEMTCIHFKGDRPCKPYWQSKLYQNGSFKCSRECSRYKKMEKRILLIKLDALGDVLRTTPLAEGIKKKFPNSQLTWLVSESGSSLLKNNPFVDRILTYKPENLNALYCESFDLLINLDKDKRATAIANRIIAKEKKGFLLSPTGVPFPVNKGSRRLYDIALDNWGAKTSNTKNFQEMTFEAAELPYRGEEYFLKLDKEDLDFAEKFKKKLKKNQSIIGINSGCGRVYPHKKWYKEGIIELIKKLKSKKRQVLLFGGSDELELNREIIKKSKPIDTGANNGLMQFAALLNICDVIFAGDTLAIHLAIALKKPVVAVFGPTPSQEIRLPKGIKLQSKLSCLNCYNQFPCIMDNLKKPNCMKSISCEEVLNAIESLL